MIQPGTFSQENLRALYDAYLIDVTYHTDHGIATLASESSATRFVRLRKPITRKLIRWQVGRFHEKPVIPSPEPEEPGLVLLNETIGSVAPIPSSGVYMFVASGEYLYAYDRPVHGATNYRIASTSVDTASIDMVGIDETQFAQGLK